MHTCTHTHTHENTFLVIAPVGATGTASQVPEVGATRRLRNEKEENVCQYANVRKHTHTRTRPLPRRPAATCHQGLSVTCLRPLPAPSGTSLSGLLAPQLFSRSSVAVQRWSCHSPLAPHYFLGSRGAKTPDSLDAEIWRERKE